MLNSNAIPLITTIMTQAHNDLKQHYDDYFKNDNMSILAKSRNLARILDDYIFPFVVSEFKKGSCIKIISLNFKRNGVPLSGNDALPLLHDYVMKAFTDYDPEDPGKTVLRFMSRLSVDFDVSLSE